MSDSISLQVGAREIEGLLSPYLTGGRSQDIWQINKITIEDKVLNADISMRSTYASSTDAKGFHLSIFSTLEFLSQLMIIYSHVWAGLEQKTQEAWMVESTTRSIRAIRNPDRIQVAMHVHSIRRRSRNLYCVADFKVTDDQGGLFEVKLKGFLG